MDKRNGLKTVFVAAACCLFFASPVKAEKSAGEIVWELVSGSFLGDAFDGIDKAAEQAGAVVKSAIPIPDIEALLEKVRIAATTLKVLKALGAPEDMDIEKILAIVRKLSGKASEAADMALEMKEIMAGYRNAGEELISSNGMELVEDIISRISIAESGEGFKTNKGESLGIKDAQSLGLKDGHYTEEIGVSKPDLRTLGPGTINTGEISRGNLLDVLESFLELLLDNAEFITKAGEIIEKADAINPSNFLKQQVAGFIDSRGADLLSKYGIDGSDLSMAEGIISGKTGVDDFNSIKRVISMLGGDNRALNSIKELADLSDSINKMKDIDGAKAMEFAVKVVGLMPGTAGAVSQISGGK